MIISFFLHLPILTNPQITFHPSCHSPPPLGHHPPRAYASQALPRPELRRHRRSRGLDGMSTAAAADRLLPPWICLPPATHGAVHEMGSIWAVLIHPSTCQAELRPRAPIGGELRRQGAPPSSSRLLVILSSSSHQVRLLHLMHTSGAPSPQTLPLSMFSATPASNRTNATDPGHNSRRANRTWAQPPKDGLGWIWLEQELPSRPSLPPASSGRGAAAPKPLPLTCAANLLLLLAAKSGKSC